MRVIPGYSKYSINESGIVVNLVSGQLLSTFMAKGAKAVTLRTDTGLRRTRAIKGLIKLTYPELFEVLPPEDTVIHEAGDLSKKLDDSKVSDDVKNLRSMFNYEPDTGLILKVSPRPSIGWIESQGYRCFDVAGKTLKAHRIIFLLMLGFIPDGEIDHINHTRSDNRWDNLRVVSKQTNMRNLSKYASNTSGVTGVTWHSKQKRWNARIMVNGKAINLGSFENKEDAIVARLEAVKKYNFHENHGESND